ncbi:helicase HerA-like domain-containing protein [Streptomyces sp. I6]|uniref:helicase HerA-like domain-containing protein n=1 Tax=Streptomyces sp. I6 TaxID=2483113 RepID=UPI0037D99632
MPSRSARQDPARHAQPTGPVAGATGPGGTTTLQLLAEQPSSNGVRVFLADLKGDLSGIAAPGQGGENRPGWGEPARVGRRRRNAPRRWARSGMPGDSPRSSARWAASAAACRSASPSRASVKPAGAGSGPAPQVVRGGPGGRSPRCYSVTSWSSCRPPPLPVSPSVGTGTTGLRSELRSCA